MAGFVALPPSIGFSVLPFQAASPTRKLLRRQTGWGEKLKSAALLQRLGAVQVRPWAQLMAAPIHLHINEPLSLHSPPLANFHKSLRIYFVHKCPQSLICVIWCHMCESICCLSLRSVKVKFWCQTWLQSYAVIHFLFVKSSWANRDRQLVTRFGLEASGNMGSNTCEWIALFKPIKS